MAKVQLRFGHGRAALRRRRKRCPLITRDYFQGRAIGKAIGVPRKLINSEGNILWLSTPCHMVKDRGTQQVLKTLKQQKNGRFIGFGEHPQVGITDEYGKTA